MVTVVKLFSPFLVPIVLLFALGGLWQSYDVRSIEDSSLGFFNYRLHSDPVAGLPFWLLALLLLCMVNGIFMLFSTFLSWNSEGVDYGPLRMIGLNLFACPACIFIHMAVRYFAL